MHLLDKTWKYNSTHGHSNIVGAKVRYMAQVQTLHRHGQMQHPQQSHSAPGSVHDGDSDV